MQKYRTDALEVAKLSIPRAVKETRVMGLQDVLHQKLVDLLNREHSRLPGQPKRGTSRR
jgi:hypothetical protein